MTRVSDTFLKGRENTWPLVILAVFCLVYVSSLTFVYVEGDDAASVAYHLLGRNRALQPPFAPYHGMMDLALSILPAQEATLRIASLFTTSLATIGMTILLLALVFDWIGELSASQKWILAATLMLASPELLYLGLVYSPTSVAMCFVIGAHLVLRRASRATGLPDTASSRGRMSVLASVFLFGLGVACRWNVVVYGAVIVTDLLTGGARRHRKAAEPVWKATIFPILWGGFALLSSVVAIAASGYGPKDIMGVSGDVNYYIQETGSQVTTGLWMVLDIGANLLSLVTPAFLALGLVGFLVLLRRRDPLAAIVVVGIAGVIPWMPAGVPKLLMTAVPGMVLCVLLGFVALWYQIKRTRPRLATRVAICLLLVGPWLIGLRITKEGSAWGPGFEIRPYDRNEPKGVSVAATLGPGAAYETFEGPRPMFGHAFVLLGGDWTQLVSGLAEDRHRVVEEAISMKVPVLMTKWSPSYVVNELVAIGFSTSDPQARTLPTNDRFTERHFVREDGQEVTLLYHEIKGEGTIGDMQEVASLSVEKVILEGYPRVVRHLYELAPRALEKVGPTSAILDLSDLRSGLGATEHVD